MVLVHRQRVDPSRTFFLSGPVRCEELGAPLGRRRRGLCRGRLFPRGGRASARTSENCRDHFNVQATAELVKVGVKDQEGYR